MCFNDFFDEGSCKFGERCLFSHEIPTSFRSDQQTIKEMTNKRNNAQQRKKEVKNSKEKSDENQHILKDINPILLEQKIAGKSSNQMNAEDYFLFHIRSMIKEQIQKMSN